MRIRSFPEGSRRRPSVHLPVDTSHLISSPSTSPLSSRVVTTTAATTITATATPLSSYCCEINTGCNSSSSSSSSSSSNRSVWPALNRRTRRGSRPATTRNRGVVAAGMMVIGAAFVLVWTGVVRFLWPLRETRRSLWLQGMTAFSTTVKTTTVETTTAATTYTVWTRNDTNHSLIPRILIFTHSINLLTAQLENETTTSLEQRKELITLQQNVRSIVALHPNTHVRFLTDEDCLASIRSFFARTSKSETTTTTLTATKDASDLVRFFQHEPHGMYKADLCRGTALYETGGIYLDVDLGVRLPLWDTLQRTTEFATVRVHGQSHYPGAFFQAFIAVTPRHDVIQRYVQLFLQYYRGTVRLDNPGGPLGVLLLKRAYDEIQHEQQQQLPMVVDPRRSSRVSLRLPMLSSTQSSHISSSNSSSSTATRLNSTSELWQEILYAPHLQNTLLAHVPPPTWGRRRACKFVVATSPRIPLTVPLYSRIAGSRMCPVESTDSGGTALKQNTVRNAKKKSPG